MSEQNYQVFVKSQKCVETTRLAWPAKDVPDISRYVDGDFININNPVDAIAKMESCIESGRGFTFFTMNLDHLTKLKRYPSFRELYSKATFVSADGWPVAMLASRSAKKILRTTGADLVFPVCDMAARTKLPVYLFGSTQQVLAKAAASLAARYPGLQIVGEMAPPVRFDPRSDLALRYAQAIADSGAKLCFVALGAPTQEAFSDFSTDLCPQTGFLCVGAALDFIAGTQHRAPKFLQKIGMEWAWRWALSPRRLGQRYLQCASVLIEIILLRGKNRILATGARTTWR